MSLFRHAACPHKIGTVREYGPRRCFGPPPTSLGQTSRVEPAESERFRTYPTEAKMLTLLAFDIVALNRHLSGFINLLSQYWAQPRYSVSVLVRHNGLESRSSESTNFSALQLCSLAGSPSVRS